MMTRQTQISTIVSIIFHVLALLIFAGVKVYTDRSIESSMAVTFVGEQRARPRRRSVSVRPMISPDESPRRHDPEQHTVRPERRSPVEFYVSAPVKVFSAVNSVGQELFQDTGTQRPEMERRGQSSSPIVTEIPEESRPMGPQMQSRISGGHELLSDAAAPAEPDIDLAGDVLQNFARVVRRKIESSKKYPVSAQKAGIEGRTSVKMVILKDGRLKKVELVKSSGREILDKAALQSVRDAAPFPPIPPKVRRDELEMSITLVFKIT